MAIRAKVRNSGSTVPTVSLVPGNEVPQRMLANKMRITSRSRAFTSRGRTMPALSLSPPRFLRKKRKKFKGFSRSPEWRVGSHVTASGTGDRNSVGAEDGPRKTDRNRGRGARPGGGWCGRRLLPDPAAGSDGHGQGRVHYLSDRTLQRRGHEFAEWDRDRRELDQQPGGITVQGKVYNISLVFYDDQSVQGNVNTLYPQIIEQDKAQFLLAPYSTLLTSTAAPIADNYDRVMLSHGGAADTIWTGTTRRNLVEVLSPASVYLKGAVEGIHTNHAADKIAVLHESDSFSTLAANSAIIYAQSLGLNVVYNQSYPTGATDLSPQLNAAMAAGADDLLGGGHFNDGLLIMNQLN